MLLLSANNLPGARRRRLRLHSTRIKTKNRGSRCEHSGCSKWPLYAFEGEKAKYCSQHKVCCCRLTILILLQTYLFLPCLIFVCCNRSTHTRIGRGRRLQNTIGGRTFTLFFFVGFVLFVVENL